MFRILRTVSLLLPHPVEVRFIPHAFLLCIYCSGKKHRRGTKHVHFCSSKLRVREHNIEKSLLLVHLKNWEWVGGRFESPYEEPILGNIPGKSKLQINSIPISQF